MWEIDRVTVDPQTARVYEHGWQSWSPSIGYRVDQRPLRPTSENSRVMNWRPDTRPSATAFWGEGLLAVHPGAGGQAVVFAAPGDADKIPSIRAEVRGDSVIVSADGPVHRTIDAAAAGLVDALARWADGYAASAGVALRSESPTVWCSWYHYFTRVSEADVDENLAAIGELGLEIDVVQIDDGYQAEIGDWLVASDRFASLEATVGRIRAAGRRAGIWVAPFLVSPRSATYRAHPEWLLPDVTAGSNWGAEQGVLDVTHPGADAYLRRVFTTFRDTGIDYFKIDFAYAGAMVGRRADPGVTALSAYRRGLALVRESIGDESYLLGCGAPILPSVGLVDAMRISPDTAPEFAPSGGDLSMPSQQAAMATGRGRAWQHGRFWANDADCLLARPQVEHRERWAEHVERYGGLRSSSDRLRDLDAWGLATTRRLVRRTPVSPFPPTVDDGETTRI